MPAKSSFIAGPTASSVLDGSMCAYRYKPGETSVVIVGRISRNGGRKRGECFVYKILQLTVFCPTMNPP